MESPDQPSDGQCPSIGILSASRDRLGARVSLFLHIFTIAWAKVTYQDLLSANVC